MHILMLGDSFTFTGNMPRLLAGLTGAEVVHHTRGGARLSEQLKAFTGWTAQIIQYEIDHCEGIII